MIERYQIRQEQDGSWTVFDSSTPSRREGRMMAGISEQRARQYMERLNVVSAVANAALPEVASAKQMREDQIPDFVREIEATGCDIKSVGDDRYTVGDADLSAEDYEAAEPELERIWKEYGDHGHLNQEIVAYLQSIGRCDPRSAN